MYIRGTFSAVEGDTVSYTATVYDYDWNEVDITDEKFTFEWYTYDNVNRYSEVLGTGSEYTIESISQTDFYTESNNYRSYICKLYVDGEYILESSIYISDKANVYHASGDSAYIADGESATFKPTVYDYNWDEVDITDEKFTFEWYTYDTENGYSEVLGTGAEYTIESVSDTDSYNESNKWKQYECKIYANGSYAASAMFTVYCIKIDDVIVLGETKTVTLEAYQNMCLEFTPEEDVTATIYSLSDGDPYGYLYTYKNGAYSVGWYFNNGGESNVYDFSFSYDYIGGETYVFVLCNGSDEEFTYDVTLEEVYECSHNYVGTVTEPTCTTGGYTTYVCSECGDTYVSDYTVSAGHTYKMTTTKATCTTGGYTTYVCSECGDTYVSDYTSATGHTYKTTTTKATTSKNGSIVKKCSVCGKVASNTTIAKIKSVTLSKTSYTYTGKQLKPTVTVKDSNGKKIASSNYTVTYKNNKNVGKATVTIKFKGNYSGTVTKTFTINPKATSISKLTAKSKGFTVKWKKQSTQTTGYQIQYATNSKFTKNKKTVTIGKTGTTSLTKSKLKAKTKYYVRVRTYKTVSGKKYYSAWSKVKTVTTKK